jgi:hypothetical protein
MFKEERGNGECKSCDLNAVKGSFSTHSSVLAADPASNQGEIPAPISRFNCTCEKGDFLIDGPPEDEPDYRGHGHCSECPDGANCTVRGITLRTLPLKPSYWRSSEDSFYIELCKVGDACAQSNVTAGIIESQCAKGHEGPICNVCSSGYSKDVSGVCKPCDDEVQIPKETIIVFIVLVGLIAWTIWVLRKRRKLKKMVMSSGDSYDVSTSMRVKFKILAAYYQIVTQYESVLQIRFPAVFENFARKVSALANLDALKLGRVSCVVSTDFYTKLVFSTAGPLIITFLIFAAMVVGRAVVKERFLRKSIRDSAVELFLAMTFLVFSSVSTTIFDTFNCRTYGDDQTKFLTEDQSISCDDPAHRKYETYAFVMMVCFPLGIPLLYFALLFNRRHEIQSSFRLKKESLIKTSFLWVSCLRDHFVCCFWLMCIDTFPHNYPLTPFTPTRRRKIMNQNFGGSRSLIASGG